MTINQSDLDSFHEFASHLLASAGHELNFDDLVANWCAERQHAETVQSVRRGIKDAEAGHMFDIADVDAKIRRELGFPPRGK